MVPECTRSLILVNSAGLGREVAVSPWVPTVPGMGELLLMAVAASVVSCTRN